MANPKLKATVKYVKKIQYKYRLMYYDLMEGLILHDENYT